MTLPPTSLHEFDSNADTRKYILNQPTLNVRLAKLAVLLQQDDIEYDTYKAIKSPALVDFLKAHPVPNSSPPTTDFTDKEVMLITPQKGWEIFFDGASRSPTGEGKEDA